MNRYLPSEDMSFISNNVEELLPTKLPLLPLYGAVLLPRTQLPIPILEEEYLSLVSDCIKGNLMVGVVQPMISGEKDDIQLFSAGSLAKILEVNEVEEHQLVVTLGGVCRFDLTRELPKKNGYRMGEITYDRYHSDFAQEIDFIFDRQRLIIALEKYFKNLDIEPDWKEISKISNERLITSLAMACPFAPREKQALLESPSLKSQSEVITTLIEFAALEGNIDFATSH